MTTKSEILRRLPAFTNESTVIVKDQDTDDIIKAILQAHDLHKADYDKICSLFYTGDEISTAEAIFNYIKRNVKYVIEKDDLQLIKAPAAIFATPSSDCKNYALAINGLLDACRRKYGCDYELYYRFAAYDGSTTPQHVFAVMNIDGEEIWIDPVLSSFNEDKQPNFYKDKKIKKMALMALSGVETYDNYQTAQTRSVGAFTPPRPPMLTSSGIVTSATAPKPFNLSSILSGGNLSTLVASSSTGSLLNVATTGLSFLGPIGAAAGAAIQAVSSLFKKQPSRDEWRSWDILDARNGLPAGRSVYWWIFTDGDSVENEANNILSYIKNKPSGFNDIFTAAKQVWNVEPEEVLRKLFNKLQRGGYGAEAAQIEQAINEALKPTAPAAPSAPGAPGAPEAPGTKTAGMSPFIILALVGAGAAIFLRKKK